MPPWPIGLHPVAWRRGILWRLLGFVAPCLAAGCVGACFRLPQQAVMWFNLVIAILQQSLLEQASPKCVISRCLHRADRCRMERRGCFGNFGLAMPFSPQSIRPSSHFQFGFQSSLKSKILPASAGQKGECSPRARITLLDFFTSLLSSCGLKINNSLRSLTLCKRAGVYSEAGI